MAAVTSPTGRPASGLQLLPGPGHADPEETQPGGPAPAHTGGRPRSQRGHVSRSPSASVRSGPGGDWTRAAPHCSQRVSSPHEAQTRRRARPVRFSTHATRCRVRMRRDQSVGVEAQAGIVVAAVDHLEGRPAQPFAATVDQADRCRGQQLHGGAGTDDDARDARPPGPLGGDGHRAPRRRSRLRQTLVVAVDDHHRGQPGTRRPRCGPGPHDHGRHRPGRGPSRPA